MLLSLSLSLTYLLSLTLSLSLYLFQLMKQIFGKSEISSISTSIEPSVDPVDAQNIRQRARRSVQALQRDRVVVETKKFAGQSVE